MSGTYDIRSPLGIYEKALRPEPLKSLFSIAARLGFDCFEISLDESDARLCRLDWPRAQADAVRRCAADSGIRLFSACLSGHRRFPLGSADPEIEKRAVEILQKAVIFCERVGIRVLQVMSYDVFYEPSSGDTVRRYLENLAGCARFSEAYGVTLAVEPIEHTHFQSPSDVRRILEHCGSPWLKIYPDVANMAAVGIDPLPEIEGCMSDMAALHIREALPEFFGNVPFGTGIVPFDGLFSLLKRKGYAGPINIEMWYEEGMDDLSFVRNSLDFVRSGLAAAK